MVYRLTLANWFRHSNITVLVIDKKHGPTCRGKADGLKSTTNEIFETFGIGPQIEAESWRIEEIAIWGPSATEPGIVREEILFDKVPELGKPRESILQQGGQTSLVNPSVMNTWF
jgi:2-polyprenyl-6-methoxyphenol hydroxylase and related FAD-dependent oxidoreductases